MLTLTTIWDEIWSFLAEGASSSAHPFYTGALTTIGTTGPTSRMVVLREATKETLTLTLHSDIRAAKIRDIRANPSVHWLFWNAADQVQLRISTLATLHYQDDVARAQWAHLPGLTKGNFSADLVPGGKISDAQTGIDTYTRVPNPSDENSEAWYRHFVVVQTNVQHVDWLSLSRSGHRRASFDCTSPESCQMSWLIP